MLDVGRVGEFEMFHDEHNAWEIVRNCVGQRISSLYRVYGYDFWNEEISLENRDELQINFANGQVLLLSAGIAGQALKAAPTPWQDQLAGNAQVFQDYLKDVSQGGWVKLIDVSGEALYRDIIGQVIQAIYPIRTIAHGQWLSGVHFVIGDLRLNFIHSCDYCEVLWGDNHAPYLESLHLMTDYRHGYLANNFQSQGK